MSMSTNMGAQKRGPVITQDPHEVREKATQDCRSRLVYNMALSLASCQRHCTASSLGFSALWEAHILR